MWMVAGASDAADEEDDAAEDEEDDDSEDEDEDEEDGDDLHPLNTASAIKAARDRATTRFFII